jgi:hypothetical protein
VFGVFKAPKIEVSSGVTLPSGIYNANIIDCEIGDNALVMNVGLLANYIVDDNAVLLNVKSATATAGTSFGNGIELSIAIESGGREVVSFADMTVGIAEKVASSRADKNLLKDYQDFVEKYTSEAASDKGIIQKGAVIKNTSKVENTFVGEAALIDNANLVKDVTILSNPEEKTKISDGAYVKQSLLQWGCEVTSMAIVDSSVLTEHSHVERHGKVTQSIVGPNTGIAEGEVTASLVGPFVGFHHQALLIAAFWPEGKGNVGYGANVGSNHTSKAPDQEIWCGEGTFFGLGVNIKFPSDFTKAPYSIIATAVNALPQRIEFPFSLINSPAAVYPGISPAYDEIMPGWVLSDNIYTVKRNEGKYKKRNKARRSEFVFDVFRPDIMDLVVEARARLKGVTQTKDMYTDRDIKGLGKNYMLESSRLKGIEAYTFYLRYYALLGLKEAVEKLLAESKKSEIAGIYDRASDDNLWEHQREIVLVEFPDERDVGKHLRLLTEMQERIARDVQTSKEKDDKRGMRVIKDYAEAHKPAAEDGFVKETWEVTRELQKEIEAILKAI